MEFPLMVYRHGSMMEWDGEMFDYLVIEPGADAEDEAKAALKDGWSVGKPEAKAKKAVKAEPATGDDGDDDDAKAALADLRAEYKKVVGKTAFNGWDADTLKAKIADASKND